MGTASESIPNLSLRRRGEPQIVIMEIKDLLKTISTEKKVITAIRNTGEKRDRRTDTDF